MQAIMAMATEMLGCAHFRNDPFKSFYWIDRGSRAIRASMAQRDPFPDPASPLDIPQTDDAVIAAAAAIGMVIPEPCKAGVSANLALLRRHAAILTGADEAA